MHQALSSNMFPTTSTLFIILLLSSAATPVHASSCLFYTTKEACIRYTDSGSCRWNAEAKVCLEGGPPLLLGTVAAAIVGLDPQSAPLELKPGPSLSFGNVSLENGNEINVKCAEQKSLNISDSKVDDASVKAKSKLDGGDTGIPDALKSQAESPKAEFASFCTQPLVMGRCRGFFPRWYWDDAMGRCEEFTFGGCGGNENNFASQQECEIAAQEYC